MYILNIFKNTKNSVVNYKLQKKSDIDYNVNSKIETLFNLFNNENQWLDELFLLKKLIDELNICDTVNEIIFVNFHNSIIDYAKINISSIVETNILLYNLVPKNKYGNYFQDEKQFVDPQFSNQKLIIFNKIKLLIEYLKYFQKFKIPLKKIFDINILSEFSTNLFSHLTNSGSVDTISFESLLEINFYKKWQNYFNNYSSIEKINCPNNTKLILPMAGLGSRFSIKGYTVEKPFIEISGKPMIVKSIECLPNTDAKYLGCLTKHIKKYDLLNYFKKYFQDVTIVPIENLTSGQAITCQLMLENINIPNHPILINACDNGIFYDNNILQQLFNDKQVDIIVFAYKNQEASYLRPEMYSWLKIDEHNTIKYVYCKSFPYVSPLNNYCIIGTMYFKEAKYFLDGLQLNISLNIKNNGEFYVDEVINRCIEAGLNVKMFEVYNYLCWGTPEDLDIYNFWKSYFTL